MDTFLSILFFTSFIVTIVGLIKPTIILRWSKKPTRLKALGLGLLLMFVFALIGGLTTKEVKISENNFNDAKNYISQKKYDMALTTLKEIKSNDSSYNEAQVLIHITDSLIIANKNEIKNKIDLKNKKSLEDKLSKQKEQLETELKSINDGIDFSSYRGSVESLQLEIAIFGTWAKIIKEGFESGNPEIVKLTKQLKTKVENLQQKQFPLIRKEYTKIAANKLWEEDVDIYSNGTGNKIINFTAALFVTNKNKQEFQNPIYEILNTFRFSQSRYRWYKGESEYTYYKVYEGNDSDLVSF
ncbi:MAG: hypothetical protein ACOYO1_15720 [Bacteroidales bacterium]